MCDENLVSVDPVRLDRAACESVRLKLTSESMGCSASRGDGLQHEEALQHVIQMMRELKVKQIANIAARREGRSETSTDASPPSDSRGRLAITTQRAYSNADDDGAAPPRLDLAFDLRPSRLLSRRNARGGRAGEREGKGTARAPRVRRGVVNSDSLWKSRWW